MLTSKPKSITNNLCTQSLEFEVTRHYNQSQPEFVHTDNLSTTLKNSTSSKGKKVDEDTTPIQGLQEL